MFIDMCIRKHTNHSYPYSIDCKYPPAIKCGNGKSPIHGSFLAGKPVWTEGTPNYGKGKMGSPKELSWFTIC